MKISEAQGKALLSLHLTHNVGGFPFKTYQALERLGMVKLGFNIEVTKAGKAWCDENHLKVAA
jgi:hypothetical protein